MATVDTDIKDDAHRLIDQLPPKATWDDLQYAIYVRIAVEQGINDADSGHKIDDAEFCTRYGLRS